jgi:hypothetical protein
MDNMLNKHSLIQKTSVEFQREIEMPRGGLNTLYKLSADQGTAGGQFCYGRCLELGRGTEIDASVAARYFKLSAGGDYPFRVLKWVDYLEYGKGRRTDACEAARCYTKFVEEADCMKNITWIVSGELWSVTG